jgi:epoxyqueuosine reductase
VCPCNKFSKSLNEPLFHPREDLLEMNKKDCQEITKETFNEILKGCRKTNKVRWIKKEY